MQQRNLTITLEYRVFDALYIDYNGYTAPNLDVCTKWYIKK